VPRTPPENLRAACGDPGANPAAATEPVSMAPRGCYRDLMPQAVEVQVGGRTYRLLATEDAATLQRLAHLVDDRLRELAGSARPVAPQALLLAALSLAHDLEQEQTRRREQERRSRHLLSSVLQRIDAAVEEADRAASRPVDHPYEEPRPTPDG